MMKKLFVLTLVFCFLTVNAFASVVEFKIGQSTFSVEKDSAVSTKTVEAPPFIENGRTMVPVRAISEAFGSDVSWNQESREVAIKKDGSEVKLYIDSTTAYINGVATTLDVSPKIVNSRTFVPVRFISEALKYNVNYASTSSDVVIDDTPVIVYSGNKTVTLAQVQELFNVYKALSEKGDITDEEFKDQILSIVVDDIARMALFENAFSYFNKTEAEYYAVSSAIASTKEDYKSKMDGLTNLVLERFFFSGTDFILNHIAMTENLEENYKKNYVCAKHVLVTDRSTAQKVYDKARQGYSFELLIEDFGQDPGMEQNPKGYVFTSGEMVEEFEKSAFSLREGEVSGIIETEYGFHIIKRYPLPQVTEEIKTSLASGVAVEKLAGTQPQEFNYKEEELKKMIK